MGISCPILSFGIDHTTASIIDLGLGLLEYPMLRYITENRPYDDDDIKLYVIEAIKQSEITYQVEKGEIEESPIISDTVLKGCKEHAQSQKKRSKLTKLNDRVKEVSRDPEVRAAARERDDGKKKGRLASQSDMTEGETLSKLVRTISPKMK